MSLLKAIIVEDSETFARTLEATLDEQGFDSITLGSLAAFDEWERRSSPTDTVDLIILDRQLPLNSSSEPKHEIGAVIFDRMLASFPDAPIVHLTGHSEHNHLISSIIDRPKISTGSSSELDSVYYFKKSEVPEFEERVKKIAESIHAIDDIELIFRSDAEISQQDRRLLRRICHDFDGATIEVRPMSGGLTSASVWLCRITRTNRSTIEVIAKSSKRNNRYSELQQATNSSAGIVGPIRRVTGLSYGRGATIYQLAGSNPRPLFEMFSTDVKRAAELAENVLRNLETAKTDDVVSLEDLTKPFISWEKLLEISVKFNVRPPRRTIRVSINRSVQHGDLHAGNILVVGANPFVIDLDSEGIMSALIDPITLLWSSLFHPDSPFTGIQWPQDESLSSSSMDSALPDLSQLVSDCPPDFEPWLSALWPAVVDRSRGPNDFWGLTMGFAARQLHFQDIQESPALTAKALALFGTACSRLQS